MVWGANSLVWERGVSLFLGGVCPVNGVVGLVVHWLIRSLRVSVLGAGFYLVA